jgi:hypothetical protein
MSKISIERTAFIKIPWLLILLPILFSCSTPCPSLTNIEPYNCDQCKPEFAACIKKNFPVGSSYTELSSYMEKIGFGKIKNPVYLKKGMFSFYWSANNLGNVKIFVRGHYDNELKIKELYFIPRTL